MFRELSRVKQQLTKEECIEILKNQKRGVLSVLGDDDYPYGMPVNQFYCEEDGKLYFHGGKTGHKIDSIKKHDKVSFCIYDEGYREEADWALHVRSVIVFGRVRIVKDHEKAMDICRRLSLKFTSDMDYIEKEFQMYAKNTLCFELVPEFMTGKLVNES